MTKATTRVAAIAPQNLLDAKPLTQQCCHKLRLPSFATPEKNSTSISHGKTRTIGTFARSSPGRYGTRERSTERSATQGARHQQGKTHTKERVRSRKIASTSTQHSRNKTPNQSQVQREQKPARRSQNRTDSSTHPRTQLAETKAQQMHQPPQTPRWHESQYQRRVGNNRTTRCSDRTSLLEMNLRVPNKIATVRYPSTQKLRVGQFPRT